MVEFQKPGDPAELAVDLVNTWDALEADPELLRDAGDLRRFLAAHGLEEHARRAGEHDLARVRELRDGLRGAFDAAEDETAVERLNAIAREAGASPQLERAEGGWRFRYAPASGSLVDALAGTAAVTLLEIVRTDGWERFGACAGAPCCCVYVDRSKNRSRRYCSQLCADRMSQAAYRRRKRSR